MSHRVLVTSAGTPINHYHKDQVQGELTPATQASYQASTLAAYPGIFPVEYTHLDHVPETLLPTNKYNCWGFTFNPRQCWISTGADIQNILSDNGTQVFAPNLRLGDVVCYRNSSGVITHTGRIWSLNASGQPELVQSKWGSLGEYLHPPLTVPAVYGTDISFWRVVPISGRGDAWVKDCAADDRNPFAPCGALWLSPDLWCNNSGGTTHENPVRGQANQLWVRVHNADTLPVSDARVRVYWSDPTGGMPHWHWHLITTAPLNVAAGPGASTVAGPVMWTPGLLEPKHCCLFAIVDTGDDWHAPATLDPIVWPFDVARDNNIIWKNMWIIELLPPLPPPPIPDPRPKPDLGPLKPDLKLPGLSPERPGALEFVAANVAGTTVPLEVRIRLRAIGTEDLEVMGLDPRLAGTAAPTPRFSPKPALHVELAPDRRLFKAPVRPALRLDRELVLTTPPLAPGKMARLHLEVSPLAEAQPGDVYRLDFEQRINGQTTGGGTYVIVIKDR